ncbi:hypothetical protein [Lacinutrix jangbogonensis]|uniref:hypothetical protein n=1 Tax=Lacinutrix jangbogonensis TaxID=1469557 RepID=UPI00053DBBC7|nr:hypothetical protein [Lacinutrix jangbogonensis]
MSKQVITASHATFSVVLSNAFQGTPVLENPVCEYNYLWDFEKNMGIAKLISVNGTPVNITLHPLGIKGYLDFMSDIPPTKYSISADPGNSIALIDVTIYRVILDIDLETGARSAAIMFNTDGSTIQTTSNFSDESSRL